MESRSALRLIPLNKPIGYRQLTVSNVIDTIVIDKHRWGNVNVRVFKTGAEILRGQLVLL